MTNRIFIILLVFISLISGIFWGYTYGESRPLGDGTRNDAIALLIIEKGLFNKDDLMNHNIDRPFYPFFMSLIYRFVGHNYLAIKIANLIFFILLVLLVYKTSQLVFNEQLARLAGLLTALCYSIASYIGWFYREVFFCFLIVLLIYCLYKAQITDKKIWFIFSGVVAALATLTSVIVAIFPFFIIVGFLILNGKSGFKNIYPKIALFFIFFSLAVAPWVVSSYLNWHRFFFSAGTGLIMPMRAEIMHKIDGNYYKHLIGSGLGDFFAYKFFPDYNPKDSRLGWQSWQKWDDMTANQKIDRALVDKILTEEAKRDIFNHPIMYGKLVFLDLIKFNSPLMPNVDIQAMFGKTHPEIPDILKAIIILSIRLVYWIFFGLVIYAVIKNFRKNWPKIGWLVLIALYFNLIYSNLIAHGRYSMPIYPFYIILASVGFLMTWDKIKDKIFYHAAKIQAQNN